MYNNILTSLFRKQIQEAIIKTDPESVAARGQLVGQKRERKEFIINSPNRVLSIDGHDKLS